MTAPMYKKMACVGKQRSNCGGQITDRIKELIDNVLKRVILRMDTEPIIPGKAVADHKAAQDVVRANDANHSESEERECYAKGQDGFVIDQTTGVS